MMMMMLMMSLMTKIMMTMVYVFNLKSWQELKDS